MPCLIMKSRVRKLISKITLQIPLSWTNKTPFQKFTIIKCHFEIENIYEFLIAKDSATNGEVINIDIYLINYSMLVICFESPFYVFPKSSLKKMIQFLAKKNTTTILEALTEKEKNCLLNTNTLSTYKVYILFNPNIPLIILLIYLWEEKQIA